MESKLAGYKMYQTTWSHAYGTLIATLQDNATSCIPIGVQSGTTYFFTVATCANPGNKSLHSNEVGMSIF
jgi:hypothetical protein